MSARSELGDGVSVAARGDRRRPVLPGDRQEQRRREGELIARNKINAVKLRGLLETREKRAEGVGGA